MEGELNRQMAAVRTSMNTVGWKEEEEELTLGRAGLMRACLVVRLLMLQLAANKPAAQKLAKQFYQVRGHAPTAAIMA